MNALTAVLARENPGLIINACCPGWVSTDSKSSKSAFSLSATSAARRSVHLDCATLTLMVFRSGQNGWL